MNALNRIESEHIQRLESHELVTLLRMLLYAEAKHRRASVHVPLQINVSDGGEDGRWVGELEPDEFIPDKFSLYQVKAENLGPADCKSAVADRGRLKAALNEVLTENGCYLFFCRQPYVQTHITNRIDAAKGAIAGAGRQLTRPDQIRFLDANKIAAWTNRHASAIAYVCECCQLPQNVSFRTWKDWRRDPPCRMPVEFQSNPHIEGFIASARQFLVVPGNIVRITGLSGLGKTRLASEILGPPKELMDVGQGVLSETTVYLDMEYLPVAVLDAVSQFEAAGLSGTIVVDNCPREQHLRLEQIIRRDGCKLSLLTLDYVPEASRSGILHILLTPEIMRDIVLGILKQFPKARQLSDPQLDHIASFAQGFPQIATLMAEVGDTVDLARLDERLIAKKILWGRDTPNEQAKEVLSVLSLFTHVGFEGEVKMQREFVRAVLCARLQLSDREFDRLLEPFVEKRIVQKAGDYVMVTPAPLAVALAADWWGLARADELTKLIPQLKACGMTKFFCQRVQQLHFSPNVRSLAAQLCGDTGPLCDAEVLNTELGSELFRALVELNPAATMDCLWRLFSAKSREELMRVDVGRRNMVWALEKLCWSKETFIRAATLLLAFGAAENEGWANNATAQFKQLFQLYLAGTQMPAVDRLEVIETGLASRCEHRQRICIEALGTALQGHHYSRMGGVEVRGSGVPEQDWEPLSNRDIADYWLRAVSLLKTVILHREPHAQLAKKTLGSRLRTVLIPPLLDKVESEFREVADAEGNYWPEAMQSIYSHLEYSEEQTPESRERLLQWAESLIPEDFGLKLKLLVSGGRIRYRHVQNGSRIDEAEAAAENLADEALRDGVQIQPLLSQLLRGEQLQAFAFGQRLGKQIREPKKLIEDCLSALRRIEPAERNSLLLAGILQGVGNPDIIDQTIEMVSADDRLVDLTVPLVRAATPNRQSIEKVLRLVSERRVPPDRLRQLANGFVLNRIAPSAMEGLFTDVTRRVPEARAHVFEVLSTYSFQSNERWEGCRSAVRDLLISPGFASLLARSGDFSQWEDAVSKLLNKSTDTELAISVTQQLIELQKNDDTRCRGDNDQRRVLRILFSKYTDQSWPPIGTELLSKSYYKLGSLLGSDGVGERQSSALWSLPRGTLVDWISSNPSALPRVLRMIALFVMDEGGEYLWHPTALALLDRELSRESVGAVWSNLLSYSSWGSRVPYIEKRIKLVRQIEKHSNASVRSLAKSLIASFEQDKARSLKQDEEHNAGIFS